MACTFTVLSHDGPFAIVKPHKWHTTALGKAFPIKLVKEYLPLLSYVKKAFGPERFPGQKTVAFIGGGAAVAHAGLSCTYYDVDVFVLCSSSELAEAVCTEILWKGVQGEEQRNKLILTSNPSSSSSPATSCFRVFNARDVPTELWKEVGYFTQFVLCYCPDLRETTPDQAAIHKWLQTFDIDISRCYIHEFEEEEATADQVVPASVAVSLDINPCNPRASIIKPTLHRLLKGKVTSLDLKTLDRMLKYEERVFSSRWTIAEVKEAKHLDVLRNIVKKATLFIRKEKKLFIAPYETEPTCMCFLEDKHERQLSDAVRKALGAAAKNWFCHSECLAGGAVTKSH